MGCDIHFVFEKKNDKDEWEYFHVNEDNFPDERDYEVFSFLCGVRSLYGCVSPKLKMRGLPDSFESKYIDMEDDIDIGDHSFAWATWKEINKIKWTLDLKDCQFKRFFDHAEDIFGDCSHDD